MTFSSNEAECIGGRHAGAGTKQKSWGWGGHVYQGQNRLVEGTCLKIDKEEKKGGDRRPGEKSGPACMSLIF